MTRFEKTLTEALSDITLHHIIENTINYMEHAPILEARNVDKTKDLYDIKIKITKDRLSTILSAFNNRGLPQFKNSKESDKPYIAMRFILENLLKQKIEIKHVNIQHIDVHDVYVIVDAVIMMPPSEIDYGMYISSIIESTNGALELLPVKSVVRDESNKNYDERLAIKTPAIRKSDALVQQRS